jgi:hypothetical protein
MRNHCLFEQTLQVVGSGNPGSARQEHQGDRQYSPRGAQEAADIPRFLAPSR